MLSQSANTSTGYKVHRYICYRDGWHLNKVTLGIRTRYITSRDVVTRVIRTLEHGWSISQHSIHTCSISWFTSAGFRNIKVLHTQYQNGTFRGQRELELCVLISASQVIVMRDSRIRYACHRNTFHWCVGLSQHRTSEHVPVGMRTHKCLLSEHTIW